METINVSTHAAVGVYNCNPPPNPDNAANEPSLPLEEQDGLYLQGFGLSAPIPPWVMPQYRRNTTQVANTNRIQGPNEPGPIRGLAWSTDKNSFYVTDGTVLKMSADGMSSKRLTNNSAFLIPTDNLASYPTGFQTNVDSKAVAILKVGGVNKLFIGCRMDKAVSGNTNGWIMEVDPETGVNLGQIALNKPPGGALGGPDTGTGEDFGGLIALAQHPVTGVVYGIRKTDDAFQRELITINLTTGNTTLVGNLGMHLTSMAFVPAIQITKNLQKQRQT